MDFVNLSIMTLSMFVPHVAAYSLTILAAPQ